MKGFWKELRNLLPLLGREREGSQGTPQTDSSVCSSLFGRRAYWSGLSGPKASHSRYWLQWSRAHGFIISSLQVGSGDCAMADTEHFRARVLPAPVPCARPLRAVRVDCGAEAGLAVPPDQRRSSVNLWWTFPRQLQVGCHSRPPSPWCILSMVVALRVAFIKYLTTLAFL